MSEHIHVWGKPRGATTEFGCCLSQYCACGAAKYIEGPHGKESVVIVEHGVVVYDQLESDLCGALYARCN